MGIKVLNNTDDARFIKMYRELVNIILFVANETEYKVALNYLSKKSVVNFIYNDNSYHIGHIGEYLVALVKSGDIGQESVSSCEPTLSRALETFFNAQYVITAGVCGGVNPKTNIGDVIVASEIINYESQKVDAKEIIDRSQALISQELTNLLSQTLSKMKFNKFAIKHGKVLSGAKLVSNKKFANQVLSIHPEAIALDMEGYAVARFAITHRMRDWIFIKAVSDYLYDKKGSANQAKSMRHSMMVLEKLLSMRDFLSTKKTKVLISGAFPTDLEETKDVEKFVYDLTQKLITENFKVINGYGQCVGNAVVAAAYNMQQRLGRLDKSLQDYIEIYPFPRITNTQITKCLSLIKNENRRLMTKGCVFAIFIYGSKGENVLSEGMLEEFQLAQQQGMFVIPIGFTGYMAKQLWNEVNGNINYYFPNDSAIISRFTCLDIEPDPHKLIDATIELIKSLTNYHCGINE